MKMKMKRIWRKVECLKRIMKRDKMERRKMGIRN